MLLAFVRLWAFALLLHVSVADGHRLYTPFGIAVVGAAFAVLVRPESMRLFALLLVAQLGDMVAELPNSPDHWMLDGFVGITILLAFFARRELSLDALRHAVPGARIVLLVAYSAAAVAKYNTTFLDPAVSCATSIMSRASFGLSDRLGVDAVWVALAIGAETLIAVLLLIPSTRRHGVRAGMAFHSLLTLSPHVAVMDFTATLFALFFLFLGVEDAERLLDRLQRFAAGSTVVRDIRRFPRTAALIGFAAIGFLGYVSVPLAAGVTQVTSKIVLVAILLAALRVPARGPDATTSLRAVRPIHLPAIGLTLLWAMNPYLGLRTTASFTMFASLRTEGTVANHLFLPSLRLTSWQDDLVYIESSNNPSIQNAAAFDVAIPLMGLRHIAIDDRDLVVTGRLHGERVEFGSGPGRRPLEPLRWWERKYAHFRAIPVGDRRFCTN